MSPILFLQYIFLGSLVVKVILLSWTCGIVLLVTRVKERFLLIYYVISVVVWIPVRSINWILSVRGKPISMRRVFSFSVDLFNSIMCSHFLSQIILSSGWASWRFHSQRIIYTYFHLNETGMRCSRPECPSFFFFTCLCVSLSILI